MTGIGVARPAVVELAPVDERPVAVEHEEVGRAGGLVGPGDFLRLVVEVGEGVADLGLLRAHHLGAVVGVARDVVGADADNGHPLALVLRPSRASSWRTCFT